ncbi:oxidoreductase/transition metal ion-binding protein [Rhynchospora pubera]|uniref:Oxidoreductase/transition metal ion-binding protein n=1 Tax=Rhynchospora pubera TaxID=906938 RepID=A0AAV8CYP3_9POAL|nr:oxidoreductase/transition metal ion-binding protein [Rhynchospora pubera]
MASLLAPSSPTSPQLRSGQRYRGSANFFLKMRFQPSDPRVRVLVHSRPSDVKVRSSNNSTGPLDAFSGWSNGGDDDKKGKLAGAIGAVLAGGLFFASLTFAALSFTGKSTNGTKMHMQPLTSEQTALICSDDRSEIDTVNKDFKEDISNKENSDSVLEDKTEEIENTSSESKLNFTIENISDQETEASKNDLNAADSSVMEEDKLIVLEDNDITPETVLPVSENNVINEAEDSNLQETLNAPAMADPLPVEIIASEVALLESRDVVVTQEVVKEAVLMDQQETIGSLNELDPLQETKPIEKEKEVAPIGEVEKSEISFDKTEGSFSRAGIPAPSLVPATLQIPPGNVLVPAIVDQSQSQAFAALQALKVIEGTAKPGELCTRREYARWLVAASSLSRNTVSKVYPAMYIENVTELAFDDVTPDDPDFSCIQGLAEAGLISSKLSGPDLAFTDNENQDKIPFSPESPLSRQDLVCWKMALEKRYLPEIDKNAFYKASGYIDIDKINPDAWPALVADLATGEQSITALAFGYTRLFQPGKPVTKAQAAIALSTGEYYEIVNEELARIEAEALAESAVNAHTALVAQVEKDLNAAYEQDLVKEREKVETLEKLAEEARLELTKLKAEREEEDNTIAMGRAAVESEMEVLLKLKHEMEKELEGVMSKKMEVSFERERINKLRQEIENENQSITQLKYDLEVERKALAMARAWAEEEAKRARGQARALEEARSHWEQRGIKVVVDEELQDDTSAGISWLAAGETTSLKEENSFQEKVKEKIEMLKANIAQKRVEIIAAFERLREKILSLVALLKERAAAASKRSGEIWAGVSEKAKRVIEDCKEGVEKITQKPKS